MVPMADALIDELTTWLEDNWDPDLTVGEWWDRLGNAGWSAPSWPVEWYGRGLSREETVRVQETIATFGALGAPGGLGLMLAGPTIVTHGTDDQRKLYLSDIVTGPQGMVPAVQRAGRRFRPRRSHLSCRPRRRRVDRQRPEGVDLRRAGRRPRHAHRPHRLGRAEASGHLVLRARHAPARRRRAAAA